MIDPSLVSGDLTKYIDGMLTIPKADIFDRIDQQARQERQPIVSRDAGFFMHL